MYMFQDTRAFGVAGEGSRLATVSVDEEFEQVRAEADSIRQARRATELLEAYRLLSEELAQLRKAGRDPRSRRARHVLHGRRGRSRHQQGARHTDPQVQPLNSGTEAPA